MPCMPSGTPASTLSATSISLMPITVCRQMLIPPAQDRRQQAADICRFHQAMPCKLPRSYVTQHQGN
jgi:hypothetical protein